MPCRGKGPGYLSKRGIRLRQRKLHSHQPLRRSIHLIEKYKFKTSSNTKKVKNIRYQKQESHQQYWDAICKHTCNLDGNSSSNGNQFVLHEGAHGCGLGELGSFSFTSVLFSEGTARALQVNAGACLGITEFDVGSIGAAVHALLNENPAFGVQDGDGPIKRIAMK